MTNDEPKTWGQEIDFRIQVEQKQNSYAYRACKQCGDKGFYLVREDSKLGYDALCAKYCDCASGVNLVEKHRTKENKDDK